MRIFYNYLSKFDRASDCERPLMVMRIRIFYNYLSKFERIWARDCERPLMRSTWPIKRLGIQIFIWSDWSHKWSLTITCSNSLKFGQIIVDDHNPGHEDQIGVTVRSVTALKRSSRSVCKQDNNMQFFTWHANPTQTQYKIKIL